MGWKDLYAQRKMTAEEAVARVRSGDRVVTPNAAGAPVHLINALVARKDELKNVEIAHMVPLAKAPYTAPEMEGHFVHNAIFVGGATRATIEAGIGDYTPCFFHKIPELFDTTMPVDVALIHVSAPDEHGWCSYGVTVDYEKHAAEVAKVVIAQVNENMPRTLGDSFIHVSDMDCIVECNDPILELGAPKITEIEKKIGGYCADLIHDGDTLQLGIGAIPDAVLLFLKEKKDLGIHTEMFSDGVVELVEAGVINNSKKTLHKGKSVATFLMGTRRLYDYVNNNPAVEMYPVNYVNDPVVIAKNDNLVSINSCVQIDFLGQVVSESIGPTQISGVGGQIDFIRGASMSRGGRSILAMTSTAAGGKVSKIVPFIDQWSAVTTSRNDVQYVVTEYGIAELRGHTVRDRARSLIEIAHPDFHDSLKEEFEKRFHTNY
ncbi:acetyl-CoA hydrolase/transferase family protein [Faecalispora anaeroviscerum]|uniref:acetyl-CoA hydrolase/transferase family protein n=1 Tax=Faecalispora anaeroviscerum TaxID=2991836 RepID=UPI0024B88726|nr:acetyl-CoA hydrolase/transferase C-terminal domain-containing protein [Faecalispora anaeroviscerum]